MKTTRSGAALRQALEVHRGAALLVHDAHFQGEFRQAKHSFDAAEEAIREFDFRRPVHLRLDDID